jgi:hypothetical protein
MAKSRARLEWTQTAHLLAMLYSAHRAKHSRALSPDDFNPYAPKRPEGPDLQADVWLLKKLFIDRKPLRMGEGD